MTEPVKTEDGKIESFTLVVGGEDFFCRCGCNCFHKPDKLDLNKYRCNVCDTTYRRKLRPTT